MLHGKRVSTKMAKVKEDKKYIFIKRYSNIYSDISPNWFSTSPNKFAFQINIFKLNQLPFGELLQQNEIKDVIFIKENLVLIPLNYKETFTRIINKNGDIGIVFNLSSAIPPHILDPKQHEKILDMCAAPGVKTSQLFFNGGNDITAVEKDSKRYMKLNDLLSPLGINIKTLNLDARALQGKDIFDKVLLDAPCSAEGELIINKDFSSWSSKLINSYTNTQKALIAKAITLTKDGGEIIYSTCTLSPEENEEIINWAVKRFPIKIEKVNLEMFNTASLKTIPGVLYWNKKIFDESISDTIRIVPNEVFEGFFIAKLKKQLE